MNKLGYNKVINVQFFDYFIPLFMILTPYKVLTTFSNYGIIIFLAYFLFFVFCYKKVNVFIYKPLLFFTIGSSLIYLFNNLRLGIFDISTVNNLINAFLMISILSIITSRINFERFYYFYRNIGFICCVVLIIQSIRLYIFNIPASPIALLPVNIQDYYFWGDFNGLRPSAFFPEPQAFVSYLLPLFIFSLDKNNYFMTTLIIISIFLSGSTLGILSIFLISSFYFFQKKSNLSLGKLFTFLSMFIVFILIFFSFEIFQDSVEKIFNINFANDIRLTRGFFIFSSFSFFDLLFGIGDNLMNYIIANINDVYVRLYLQTESVRLLGYVTTISGVFIRYGMILGLYYLYILYAIYNNFGEELYLKTLIFTIILLSFGQTLLFNSWFLFYFGILFGLKKNVNSENFIKLRLV